VPKATAVCQKNDIVSHQALHNPATISCYSLDYQSVYRLVLLFALTPYERLLWEVTR